MSGTLWFATIVMVSIAIGFVGLPLLQQNRRASLLAVGIFLSVFAAALYWAFGSPEIASGCSEATAAPGGTQVNSSSESSQQVGSVASMVDGLAARLREDPDDSKSWLLLAKSYRYMDRMPGAMQAYEKAAALGEFDAELAALTETPATAAVLAAQIFGNLSLSDRASKIVQPDDTVFIFARAINEPKMPVAVLQRPASDFLLNDSQAMTAAATGASEPVYLKPVSSAADAYYEVTVDQLRFIAGSQDIQVQSTGPRGTVYEPWDQQRTAKANLAEFLRTTDY